MLRNFATAGLLTLLGIFIGAPASQSETRTVKLDLFMIDYKFIPNHLTFERDVHYRLHMENHGKETHEVTALHVTHSRSEAERLGKLIFRLENGRVREIT